MMGHVLRQQGAFQEALTSIRKSLALYQRLNDDYGVAKTFAGLGAVLRLQGKFEEAIRYLEQALVLQEKIGDYRGQALTLNDLAGIAYMQMDYEAAGAIMSKGSQLLREVGDRYTLVIFLHNQAFLASTSTVREYDKAKRFAMESHVLAQEMGLQLYMARTLFVLGYLEIETETYDKAIPFFQDSLQYYRATGANHEVGSVLCGLGEAYFFLGEAELAYESFVEAIKIAVEFNIVATILLSVIGIARILNREGKKDKALQYVTTVLSHPEAVSRAKLEAIALLTELTGQNNWEEFVASQAESLAIELDQLVEEILSAF
jgi:tetratricopeptide (TPR) repeat protein